MKKITEIHAPVSEKNIFTEGIDYFEVGEDSIWGKGDGITLELLGSLQLAGKWLDLGAGDGRYAPRLLSQVDLLLAADIDCGALSKLWFRSSEECRDKLKLIAFDLTKPFPMQDDVFDGVICTGTLHYFEEPILLEILREIDRVLKPGGRTVLDFAWNVRRYSKDGRQHLRNGCPQYEDLPMGKVFRKCFERYGIQLRESVFQDDLSRTHGYILSGRFALLLADKPRN